jgi:outer membrane protein insertion porin family
VRFKFKYLAVLLCFCYIFSGHNVQAFMTPQSIFISGNVRIPDETIRSYLTFKEGDLVDRNAIDDSIKALFQTELFADVNIDINENGVTVNIVENPVINRIQLEGNKKLKDERLLNEIQLRPRVVYTRNKVQSDVERLLEIYRQTGRYAAKVEPYVITLDQNRVDLVYKINEGNLTSVHNINFLGNKRFSDSNLRSAIKTQESAWYRLFSSDDIYDPHRLEYDKELLREFYLEHGFAEFRVKSAVAELSPNKDGFYITFTVFEGEKYKLGKVDIQSGINELNPEKLRSSITIKPGDQYNTKHVQKTILNLTDVAGTLGYAFVDIRPITSVDKDRKIIDITFNIGEGPKVFVEKVNITGNFRTLDKVIRRQFLIGEGDPFNVDKLKASKRNVNNLGIFKQVDIDHTEGTNHDQSVINVDVEEKKTLEFNISGGFSNIEGILGKVGAKETNFLGKGQEVGIDTQFSKRKKSVNMSFADPAFLDKDLTAGASVFYSTITPDSDQEPIREKDVGITVFAGYNLQQNVSQSWHYTLKHSKLQIETKDAKLKALYNTKPYIRDSVGSFITSEIGHSFLIDYRDSLFEPHNGFFAQFDHDLAGLGGDTYYFKNVATGGIYKGLTDNIVLSLTGELGYILDLGKKLVKDRKKRNIRYNDRFFLGEQSFRGFRYLGLGPRDFTKGLEDGGTALGGKTYGVSTLQANFPLGLPDELGVNGRIFTDVGYLVRSGEKGANIRDKFKLRASSGVGVTWKTPFAPIGIDYAWAWLKDKGDRTKHIHFTFSTRF